MRHFILLAFLMLLASSAFALTTTEWPSKLENNFNVSVAPISPQIIFKNKSGTFSTATYYLKRTTGGSIAFWNVLNSLSASSLKFKKTVNATDLVIEGVANLTRYTRTECKEWFNESIGKYGANQTVCSYFPMVSFDTIPLASVVKSTQSEYIYTFTTPWGQNKFNFSTYFDPNIGAGPFIINTTGTYDLTNNITCSGVNCITFNATNTVLDCHGFSIIGNNTTDTWGVYTTQINSTIKNCNIQNFSSGIRVSGSSSNITNNTVNITYKTSCDSFGLCSGIFVTSAQSVSVDSNDVSAYTYGIELRNDVIAVARNNRVVTSNFYAFAVMFADTCVVEYNNLSAYSGTLYMFDSTNMQNITARFNTINANSGTALHIFGPVTNSFVYNNTINGSVGLYLDGSYNVGTGRHIEFINISNNIINSSTYAVRLYQEAYNNTITRNTLISSTSAILIGSAPLDNFFTGNNITAPVWINSDGSPNYYNNSTSGNIYYWPNGTASWNVFNIVDTNTVQDYWADTGTNWPFSASTVAGNFTGAGTPQDFHPFTTTKSTYCSNLSTANTAYNLYSNISVSGYNCLNITADNITLNCNGYTITGSNSSSTYGVYSNSFNSTVKNCRINNFSVGIYVDSGANTGNFTNNTINITYAGSAAIQSILGSYANIFTRNNLTAPVWISDAATGNFYNSTGFGNIYYFTNGTASWSVFNLTDSNLDFWADGGSSRPFNATNVAGNFTGAGLPNDWFPYVIASIGNLTFTLLGPANGSNVQFGVPFDYTINVTCWNGSCGDVSALLDPWGPDTANYTALASNDTGGDAFAWEDINTTGSLVWAAGSSVDDNYATISFSNMSFPFYGVNYSTIYVSSNGRIHFSTASASSTTATLPSSGVLAVSFMNKDMYVHSTTRVYYHYLTNPNRYIINFYMFDCYSSCGSNLNISLTFYQTGKIKIQYKDPTTAFSSGGNHGIFNSTTGNITMATNLPVTYSGKALTFYPPNLPSDVKSGAVSTTVNATPFYTTSSNPQNSSNKACLANMTAGTTCALNWSVIPTGANGTNHTFYTVFTPVNGLVSSINSTNITLFIGGVVESPVYTNITSLFVTPLNPTTSNNLSCNVTVASSNDTTINNIDIQWYLNGVGTYLCYQETATTPTSCGGQGTGLYAQEFDGSANNYFYINYTKPENSTESSLWQIAYTSALTGLITTTNLSISQACWNANETTLMLRVHFTGANEALECFDSTTWNPLGSFAYGLGLGEIPTADGSPFYDGNWSSGLNSNVALATWQTIGAGSSAFMEEAMYWNLSYGTYTYTGLANGTALLLANISSGNLSIGQNWSCSAQATSSTNTSALNMSANVTIGAAASGIVGRVWRSSYYWVWGTLEAGNKTLTWDGDLLNPWIWHDFTAGSGNKTMNWSATIRMWTWVYE